MKNKYRLNLALPLAVTLVLMVLVVIYTSSLFRRISALNIYEAGSDRISSLSASLGNYLDTAKGVLWVTADTVDFMVANGESNETILEYLKTETEHHKKQFDENYTGVYGLIGGEYLDGLGWEPPPDYDPTQRDWYKTAREADDLVIVPPYVDAQTGSVVISVCKHLANRDDVLSLDVFTNHIQEIISSTDIKGNGYGFILDKNGTVIAHADTSLNGTNYNTFGGGEGAQFMEELLRTADVSSAFSSSFETEIDGRQCAVFADGIMDQWFVVIAVGKDELFKDVYSQLAVNVTINTIVFVLLALFYYLAYRTEQKSSREAEALKISEQQKAYEAEILRLEKTAADSANKAKGDFLAQMSHEIRTPINAVLGMNEMILRESDDENILEYSGNIQTAGRTLLSLINSILDFSKIEDGKMEIIPVRYDTAGLISGLVTSVSERARAKGLEFIVRTDPGLPRALIGDDVRVTQITANLLTNAVKYTERGSVTLEINCPERSGSEAAIEVSVKDTGIGIRGEDLGKLFETFSRLDEKRNRYIEGTGLGMAIVTKLLDLMGGKLDVKSVYGKGSVFSFRLKQEIADDTPVGNLLEEQTLRHAPDRPVRKNYPRYAEAEILITDDNEMNLKVAKNLMKLFGITPELAPSGARTIELMREKHYDIVFLDHMMPKMDGIETLENLRKEGLIPDETVMIALTANAVLGAKEKYLEAGFADYLSKPIDLDDLDRILSKHLAVRAEKQPAQDVPVPEKLPEGAPAQDTGEGLTGRLNAAGFSAEQGLKYCMNDEDFYQEMLTDFADSCEARTAEINSAYAEKDWKLYGTYVHALKSAARTVGADDVSKLAEALEKAAKSGDTLFIENNAGSLEELFRSRTAQLKKLLKE